MKTDPKGINEMASDVKTKLSPKMEETLDKARQNGGRLERWPGGFWTYPNCALEQGRNQNAGYRIPDWYVSTHTIDALVKRGAVRVVRENRPGWPVEVAITQATRLNSTDDQEGVR